MFSWLQWDRKNSESVSEETLRWNMSCCAQGTPGGYNKWFFFLSLYKTPLLLKIEEGLEVKHWIVCVCVCVLIFYLFSLYVGECFKSSHCRWRLWCHTLENNFTVWKRKKRKLVYSTAAVHDARQREGNVTERNLCLTFCQTNSHHVKWCCFNDVLVCSHRHIMWNQS